MHVYDTLICTIGDTRFRANFPHVRACYPKRHLQHSQGKKITNASGSLRLTMNRMRQTVLTAQLTDGTLVGLWEYSNNSNNPMIINVSEFASKQIEIILTF